MINDIGELIQYRDMQEVAPEQAQRFCLANMKNALNCNVLRSQVENKDVSNSRLETEEPSKPLKDAYDAHRLEQNSESLKEKKIQERLN